MKKRLITAACVLFWLAVWQVGAMLLGQELLLVSPVRAACRLLELIPTEGFLRSVAFSSGRILGGFGLGLAVRTEPGAAPFLGSVGELHWNGAGGTSFWVDPAERLAVVYLMQSPSQRGRYRVALRNTIYGAFESR